jgi:hypothetical protein
MRQEADTRCPVCGVRFRGHRQCSRCGADLTPLMTLVCQSWRARQAARRALVSGEWASSRECIELAQRLHATPDGQRLELLVRLVR